ESQRHRRTLPSTQQQERQSRHTNTSDIISHPRLSSINSCINVGGTFCRENLRVVETHSDNIVRSNHNVVDVELFDEFTIFVVSVEILAAETVQQFFNGEIRPHSGSAVFGNLPETPEGSFRE